MRLAKFTILCLVLSLTAWAGKNKDKPNIILLFADDISARELPIYGSSQWSPAPQGGNSSDPKFRAQTPVLDKLAKEGVWIKTAWASTICGPSRAMMMTGRYAHIHKWWHNKDKGKWTNPEGKTEQYPLYASSPHTIGKVAKAGGYATYWAGKTQIEGVDQFGFDEACFTPGASDGKEYPYSDFKILQTKREGKRVLINTDTDVEVDYYQQWGWYWQPHVELMNHPDSKKQFEWWPNNPKDKASYGLNTYGPDIELRYIFDFIDRKSKEDEPFFIYHTSHLGHDGWDFFSPDIDPNTRNKWPGTPKIEWKDGKYHRTEPNITGDKGNYNTHGTVTESGIHTHINYLDYQIWQYMNKLKELGIEDNTVFIFCADNGTSGYGKGSFTAQMGTHVPFIVYAPCLDMSKSGEQDIEINLSDVLPTIADIVGVQIPKSYEINGVSLIPYLTTDQVKHREWIYSYHKNQQMVRSNDIMIDGRGIIYDTSSDPKDLISFRKLTVEAMSSDQKQEYDRLMSVLPQFDKHASEHDAPIGGIGKVDPLTSKK